jgi:drug/metabolite transporter superfamily protein YnfA
VIGSLIGYVVFDTSLPGRWTWFGGAVLMIGLLLIVTAAPTETDTNNQTLEASEEA